VTRITYNIQQVEGITADSLNDHYANIVHRSCLLPAISQKLSIQLEGCIVLNGPTRVLDANGISIASAILRGSLGDRPTDRPTDHATRSFTIGGAHSGEAKFNYCLRLQQVFIGAVDSTYCYRPCSVICRFVSRSVT